MHFEWTGATAPGVPEAPQAEQQAGNIPNIGDSFSHTNWENFSPAPSQNVESGPQTWQQHLMALANNAAGRFFSDNQIDPNDPMAFALAGPYKGFAPPPGYMPKNIAQFADEFQPEVPEAPQWETPEAGTEQAEQDYLKNLYGPLNTLMKSNTEVADRIMGMAAQEIGDTNTAENYRAVAQMIANQILGWAHARSGNKPPGLDPARIGAFLNNEYGHWWGTPQTLAQARAKLNGMTVDQRSVLKNAVMNALEGSFTMAMPTGNYSYDPTSGFTQRPGTDVNIGDVVQHGLGGGAITNLIDIAGQRYPEALGSDQGNPAVTQWRANRRNLMAGFRPGAYPSLPQGGF